MEVLRGATTKLEEQSERTHIVAINEQQKSRAEVLCAISDAAARHDHVIATTVEVISERIGEESETSRSGIGVMLVKQHNLMRQQIHGLETGIQRLQSEIDSKLEKLKKIIVKTNNTKDETERQRLRRKGNLATIIIKSLRELLANLQVHMNIFRPCSWP